LPPVAVDVADGGNIAADPLLNGFKNLFHRLCV
jgi:hypothetical protein